MPPGAPILGAGAMRAAEQAVFDTGVSQLELMQRAGDAVAVQVARLAAGRPILVLAGPGNNGGDAFVAGRWLRERGHDVTLAAMRGGGEGAAATMRARWGDPIDTLDAVEPRRVLLDGLFGTGLSRALDAAVAEPLARLADAADLVIGLDLPSGIGTDDGADLGAVYCHVTITLGAVKPGLLLGPGGIRSGHIILADIGIAASRAWTTLAQPKIAAPSPLDHKFSRGMVAVLGGAMPGASHLAARSAMRGGAGYVVLTGEGGGGPDALVRRPADDVLFSDERIGALLVGPGLGRDDAARALLDRALDSGRPLVIDGDALSLLGTDATKRLAGRDAILTPHTAEFSRMFGDGPRDKITRTLDAARQSGCTIVHKGADTVIAHADGTVTVAAGASTWLSTAGTGDVLAGLVAARRAAGGGDAAAEAVWLHTRAASLAGSGLIADDLIQHVPQAMTECL